LEEQDKPADPAAEPESTSASEASQGGTNKNGKRKAERKNARKNRQSAPAPEIIEVRPMARPARMGRRHWWVILSFLLFVIAPSGVAFWYLEERAADQYASTMGFSVRNEESTSAVDLLGGITGISSGSSSDADILYEFIQSQIIVESVDKRLDLRSIYTKPDNDPIFALKDDASVEDLLDYWGSAVKIAYDGGSGLIQLRVLAFDPQDAQNIAQAIFEESSLMINRLSDIAREDSTRFADKELKLAVERLKVARQDITGFRNKTQIVDPNADIQGQMGLLNTLQTQLAEALIEFDLLRDTTRDNDPRLEQASRRIVVIEARIVEERKKLGVGIGGEGEAYAGLINIYEGLIVEREYAEQSYLAALTALNAAKAEAQRQSRYLAAYVEPTFAQTSKFPERLTILGLIAVFLFLIWSILALVYYSIKDRR
jgi:capsular polysaccharide transport system permease protein